MVKGRPASVPALTTRAPSREGSGREGEGREGKGAAREWVCPEARGFEKSSTLYKSSDVKTEKIWGDGWGETKE